MLSRWSWISSDSVIWQMWSSRQQQGFSASGAHLSLHESLLALLGCWPFGRLSSELGDIVEAFPGKLGAQVPSWDC